jgi:hypothetical protein
VAAPETLETSGASGCDDRLGETGSGAAEMLDGEGEHPCDSGRAGGDSTEMRAGGGDSTEMRAEGGEETPETVGRGIGGGGGEEPPRGTTTSEKNGRKKQ